MKNIKYFPHIWHFKILGKNGKVKEEWSGHNTLANEGEQNMLDTYFRNSNAPSTFYIRLFNDTPTETDALSDLTGEASGNGYSAQEVERNSTGFPTLELDSGDYQVVTKQVTFQASGGSFGPVTYAVLATSTDSSGKLVSYISLSGSRTLNDGESLKVTITSKQA